MSYNRELIEEIQEYFRDFHKMEITKEFAIESLDSMADLFESFSEFAQIKE